MCFASSVRLAYFLLRNDSLCCVYRCWMFLQLVRCSSFLCRLCLWSRWLCKLHWWCGSCCLGGIGIFFLQLHPTVAHNCHGKTKLTHGKTKFTHRKTKKTSWSAVVICIWNDTSCNSNTLFARKTAIFQAQDVLLRVRFGSRWRWKLL